MYVMTRTTRLLTRLPLAAFALTALVGCSGSGTDMRNSDSAYALGSSVVSMFTALDGYNSASDAYAAKSGIVNSLDKLPDTVVEQRGPDIEIRVGESTDNTVVCVTKGMTQGEWLVIAGPCLA